MLMEKEKLMRAPEQHMEQQMENSFAFGSTLQEDNAYASTYMKGFMQPAQELNDNRFSLLGVKYGDSASMKKVKDQLEDANRKMLTTPIAQDEEGFQTQRSGMIQTFQQLTEACQEYINSHRKPITPSGRERKRLVEGTLMMAKQQMIAILDGAADRLFRNIQRDEHLAGITWANVLGAVRRVTFNLGDTQHLEVSSAGEAASELYVIRKKDAEGEPEKTHRKRFFKKGESNLTPVQEMRARYGADSRAPEKKRAVAEVLNAYDALFWEQTEGQISAVSGASGLTPEHTPEDFAFVLRDQFENSGMTMLDWPADGVLQAAVREMLNNPENYEALKELVLEERRYENRWNVTFGARIREGASMAERNVATSRMAMLFGPQMAKLIPQSVTAEVIEKKVGENGEEYEQRTEGIVMRQADGESLQAVYDRAKERGMKVEFTPEAARQTMWLQVFDLICGQADRHTGNRFVQWKEENGKIMITGIQGIDNDMAFGNIRGADIHHSRQHNMPSLETRTRQDDENGNRMVTKHLLPKIDRELFEAVRQLAGQESLVRHALADLLSEEEIGLVIDRLQYLNSYLQERIQRQDIEVLEKEDWNAQKVRELSENAKNDSSSYFNDMVKEPEQVTGGQETQ